MTVTLQMPPIVFNGSTYSMMVLTDSAQKHWKSKSEEIYTSVYHSLDGQCREPKIDDRNEKYFQLASGTNSVAAAAVPWMTSRPARDTLFKIYEESGDSILNESSIKKITQLEMQYEFDEKMNFYLLDTKKLGEMEATPIAHKGNIYIASRNGHLYCLGKDNSKLYLAKNTADTMTFKVKSN